MPHHASVKKAADKGILLEDAPEGSDYRFRAFWPERSMELWGSNQADLVNCAISARMFVIEHGIKFEQDGDTITVSFNDHELHTFDADGTPNELLDAVAEAIDEITDEMRAGAPVEEEDEEEARSGSVVPEKYKALYRENGTPGNCGDWLALELKRMTTGEKGKVNIDAVQAIADANGVSTAKYDRINNGWQGRFRMTVRNSLVKKVVEKGVLFVPAGIDGADDTELKAPDSWLKAMAAKHKVAMDTLAPTRKKKAA